MIDRDELRLRRVAAVSHEEFFVRSKALAFWKDDPGAPGEVTDRAVAMLERYGWEQAFEFSHLVTNLPHTPDSLEWVLARLRTPGDGASRGGRVNMMVHVIRWCVSAPLDWLEEHWNEFSEAAGVAGKVMVGADIESAEYRIEVAGWTAEQRLAELENLIARTAEHDAFPHDLVREMEVVCERIGQLGEADAEVLNGWLRNAAEEPKNDTAGYRTGAAILIATEGKVRLAVPELLEVLAIDWDWLNEIIQTMLTRAADALMMGEVMGRYLERQWFEKLFLSGAISNRAFPELEESLLKLLADRGKDDDDYMPLISLVEGAIRDGSEVLLNEAREVAAELGDFGEARVLHDALWLHDVLVKGFGEPHQVRLREIEAERKRLQKGSADLERIFRDGFGTQAIPSGKRVRESKPVTLYQKTGPKIGRNEPCPCGSGKKFKKCCDKGS